MCLLIRLPSCSFIQAIELIISSITPSTQVPFDLKSTAKTVSPGSNFVDLSVTSNTFVGIRQSKPDRIVRDINTTPGDIPLLVCGVNRYRNRNLFILFCIFPSPSELLIAFLKVCTALPARPFDAGWYGGVNMCLI